MRSLSFVLTKKIDIFYKKHIAKSVFYVIMKAKNVKRRMLTYARRIL